MDINSLIALRNRRESIFKLNTSKIKFTLLNMSTASVEKRSSWRITVSDFLVFKETAVDYLFY